MVLGPERMPKVASQLGRWAGQARNMARHLTSQIQDEIDPIKSSVNSIHNSVNESVKEMDETLKTDFSARRPEPGQPAADNSESAANVTADDSVIAEPDKDS
jgi:Sec-independent protein translocase protein TatA